MIAQSYENWELILVDDGSSDGGRAVARRYVTADSTRVRLLHHPHDENRGKIASRNLALATARGEYVAFLDSDDVWMPEKLSTEVALMEAHPRAGMVQARTLFWYGWTGAPHDIERDVLPELGVASGREYEPAELLVLMLRAERYHPANCSVLVRRHLGVKLGWFEPLEPEMYEDTILLAKLYLRAPVLVSDHCAAKYRMHDASCCHQAEATGVYHPSEPNPARSAYLRWLEAYLRRERTVDARLADVLHRELWPYRHPRVHRVLAIARAAARRARERVRGSASQSPTIGRP